MSDELREQLVEKIRTETRCWGTCNGGGPASVCRCEIAADAAAALIRAETLEEAAKAAESIKTVEIDGHDYQVDGPSQYVIVDAIRALKDKP